MLPQEELTAAHRRPTPPLPPRLTCRALGVEKKPPEAWAAPCWTLA